MTTLAFLAVATLMAALFATGSASPAGASRPPTPGGQTVEVGDVSSITIFQDSIANSPQDFSFNGCQGAGCATFSLDDDDDPTLSNSVSASGLAPGIYTVTQAPPPGTWVLDDIFCETGETVDVDARTVTIDLEPGEEVSCTFTNRSPSITIIEDAVPDSAQDFSFNGCQGAGCATFSLDDDDDPTLSNSVSASGLAPGIYTITQSPPSNWPLSELTCNTDEAIEYHDRRVTIVLGLGEHVICTFTNDTSAITIVQDTNPNSSVDFGYTGCLGADCQQFVLDDDTDPALASSVTGSELGPGTFTVTQDPAAGFDLIAIDCEAGGGSSVEVDLVNHQATIRLEIGGPIICTFVNEPVFDQISQITAGGSHTCARLTSGQARCWGAGGRLGDGTTSGSARPVVVLDPTGAGPLTDVAEIAAGASHTCARLASGQARCWGANDRGQLGDGTTSWSARPVVVLDPTGAGPLTDVAEITAGGSHTCARLASGQARCWGYNRDGEVGDGTTNQSARPVVVTDPMGAGPLTDVAEITAGASHTCARLASGQARCWGANGFGALGDGTTSGSARPVVVINPTGAGPLTGVSEITAGGSHTCARLTRQARCWGRNGEGALGNGTTYQSARPVVVSDPTGTGPLTNVAEITAGVSHTCARLTSGQARCWGWDRYGQIGNGNDIYPELVTRPTTVTNTFATGPLTDVASISAGFQHACVRLANGRGACWGRNGNGELGTGTTGSYSTMPVFVRSP